MLKWLSQMFYLMKYSHFTKNSSLIVIFSFSLRVPKCDIFLTKNVSTNTCKTFCNESCEGLCSVPIEVGANNKGLRIVWPTKCTLIVRIIAVLLYQTLHHCDRNTKPVWQFIYIYVRYLSCVITDIDNTNTNFDHLIGFYLNGHNVGISNVLDYLAIISK